MRLIAPFPSLPQELFDNIIEQVDGFPLDYDAACEIRDGLMEERGSMNDAINDSIDSVSPLSLDVGSSRKLTDCRIRSTSANTDVHTQRPPQSAPPFLGSQSSLGSSIHFFPFLHLIPTNPPQKTGFTQIPSS